MVKEDKPKKKISNTFKIIGLISAGCGAFHGFYDGIGAPLPLKHLDPILTVGPTIIQSYLGIFDGISIARTGKQATGNYLMEEELSHLINVSNKEELIKGEVYGALMGGMGEGIVAGLETLVGYTIGYVEGNIVKSLS